MTKLAYGASFRHEYERFKIVGGLEKPLKSQVGLGSLRVISHVGLGSLMVTSRVTSHVGLEILRVGKRVECVNGRVDIRMRFESTDVAYQYMLFYKYYSFAMPHDIV
ncbi:hypothetical protein KY290_021520 [Solanum tuberosum]|uniref:PilZ domain-containing protein n=1 Tax=Solanum tuberosum TaxID=4113 RepID=A0ABQ7V1U1_SOLTU|nr:hypothetical protein KY289_020679 [Solanum tuberosum]KAH0758027.1 hypothetical protein KY290_021520 [Solanum tuberosum]